MKQVYEKLIRSVMDGVPILTATKIHDDIPTIHTFAGKYHSSVNHIGFGCFVGKTENGEFTFYGGGAMNRDTLTNGNYFCWCPLGASKKVLKDLNYDSEKVLNALNILNREIVYVEKVNED